MVFTSFLYLGFLPLTAGLYYLSPKRFRWLLLLLASIGFYLAAGPVFLLYLLFTTLTVWGTALLLSRGSCPGEPVSTDAPDPPAALKRQRRRSVLLLTLCLVCNLGILFVLKYLGFSLRLLSLVTGGRLSLQPPALLMPLGISFYTFQSIGYLLDVRRGVVTVQKNPLRLLLFLSFFPSILQGPINRYNDLAPQLFEAHSYDSAGFSRGAQRILWGFFEKLVIADRLGILVNGVFSDLDAYAGWQLALCILLFAFQLYADFQGYMDIALGSAELFGITLPENFRVPYLSASVPEFWRRWHITLGAWFRDYVYIPLGGNRGGIAKTIRNLLIVWTLTGIWHGAQSNYVLWGLYYGVLIALSRLCKPLFDRIVSALRLDRNRLWYRGLQTVKTFLLVLLGWVLFRSDSLRQIKTFFRLLFRSGAAHNPLPLPVPDRWAAAAALVLFVAVDLIHLRSRSVRELIAKRWLPLRWLIWLALLCAVVLFGIYGPGYDASSFLYFKH